MTNYKWCAIDCEGDAGNRGLIGMSYWSDQGHGWITDKDTMRAVLELHASEGYTFVAHNAEYEVGVLFWQLSLPMKAITMNGRFTHGTWRYNRSRGQCELWDSLSLSGNLPLSDLGRGLGLPKHTRPQVLSGGDPDRYTWVCERHTRGECIECYAVRDVEIVYRFIQSLEQTLTGWGVEPARRLSGIVQRVWRALDHPSPCGLTGAKVKKLAREGYHGGRVETYKLGTLGPVYTADIQSAYAAVMRDTPMPDPRAMLYAVNVGWDFIKPDAEGVADVDVAVPPMHVPPLPFVRKGEVRHPVGRFRTVVPLRELRYAVSLGCTVEHVHRAAYAVEFLYPFRNTIDTLWAMREAYKRSDDPRQLHAKLLLQNLYGIMGMHEENERGMTQYWDKPRNPTTLECDNWEFIGEKLFIKKRSPQYLPGTWTNSLWAAQITGAARIRLHQYQTLQGEALVYSDTDCIFSTAPIVGTGEGLGALTDTGVFDRAIVSGPKYYALQWRESDMPDEWWATPCETHGLKRCQECRWHARAKGVRRDVAMTYLREGYVKFLAPVKPQSAIRKGKPAGQWEPIERRRQNVPHRRHPTNPTVILTGQGYSDTQPPVEGQVLPKE